MAYVEDEATLPCELFGSYLQPPEDEEEAEEEEAEGAGEEAGAAGGEAPPAAPPQPPAASPAALHAVPLGLVSDGRVVTRHAASRAAGWDGTSLANVGAAAPPPARAPKAARAGAALTARLISEDEEALALPSAFGRHDGRFRWRAYSALWAGLEQRWRLVLASCSQKAFQRVHEVASEALKREAAASAASAADAADAPPPQRLLPAALFLAGGVNQADHAETFGALAAHLRTKHCFAARLSSQQVGARGGGGPHAPAPGLSSALRCVLEQLLAAEEAEAEAAAAEGGARRTARARAQAQRRAALLESPTVAHLAAWHASSPPRARDRPLLLLIQDAECCGGEPLADLLVALADAPPALPLFLVIGVATSVSLLQALLPPRAARRLDARAVQLDTAVQRLEILQRDVLLGCGGAAADPGQARLWPRSLPLPLIDAACARLLHERFTQHDFSLAALRDALQLATLLHCEAAPAGSLLLAASRLAEAAAAGEEARADSIEKALAAQFETLPAEARADARARIACLRDAAPGAQLGGLLARAVRDFGRRAASWAAVVVCVAAAAEGAGLAGAAALGLRELFCDAADAAFCAERGSGGALALRDVRSRLALPAPRPGCAAGAGEGVGEEALWGLLTRWTVILAPLPPAELGQERVRLQVLLATSKELFDREKKVAAARRATQAAAPAPRAAGAGAAAQPRAPPPPQPSVSRKELKEILHARVAAAEAPPAPAPAPAPARAAAAPPPSAEEAAADAVSALASSRLRSHVAALLARLEEVLAQPPCTLPAAELLVCSQAERLRGYLQAAPRAAVERALLQPGHPQCLGCDCCPAAPGLRPRPTMPDAAAAYSLLARMRCEFAPVQDWFGAFLALHGGAELGRAPAAGGGKRKRGEGVGGGGGAGKAKGRGRGGRGGGRGAAGGGATDGAAVGAGVAPERLWELQARFTQAAAELQHMGLVRSAKRKHGLYVQRLVFGQDFGAD